MPKPKITQNNENSVKNEIFGSIQNNTARTIAQVVLVALPGTIVLGSSIFLTGALNIYKNLNEPSNTLVIMYAPIACLLPMAVGSLAPLFLDRIKISSRASLKASIIAAMISGFLGSLFGSFTLLASGLALGNFKPFGVTLDASMPAQIVFSLTLVIISTILAMIGGALMVAIMKKTE